MKLPEPGAEDFYKLGPEARTLARWRHNAIPLKKEEKQRKESLRSFIEGGEQA